MFDSRHLWHLINFGLAISLSIPWATSQTQKPGYIEQGAKVTAEKYRFTPSTLSFEAGKLITIVLTSLDGSHSFAIDAFKLRSKEADEGSSTVVEFIVNEPGTYEFYYEHGNHKKEGMTGRLTIVPVKGQ